MATRTAHAPILSVLLDRWSTRAFDPEAVISTGELAQIFEAARWAPSAFNVQPWRFVFATRGGAGWEDMCDILIPFNLSWAGKASALICVCSETDTPGKVEGERVPSYSHSFDAGAAWAALAVQAHSMGLSTHAMTGFDVEKARQVLKLPANVRPEAIVAVGRSGSGEHLSESLRARDVPSDRRAISELVFNGAYGVASDLSTRQ